MAEMNAVHAMESISLEVEESEIKLKLTTYCIKAQALLVEKLKKETQRYKETCGYIRRDNFNLQCEISQAEQKIKSMLAAQETIKMANVELNKDLLVAKEKKLDVFIRIKTGVKKYDKLWLESKNRYESLPFVQELLKANEKANILKKELDKLEEESLKLIQEIDDKQKANLDLEKKRVIALAKFIVYEVPKYNRTIEEKTKAINAITEQFKEYNIKTKVKIDEEKTRQQNDAESSIKLTLCKNDDDLFMPKLQLSSLDFDDISVKLDQIKMKQIASNPEKIKTKEVFPKTRYEINIFDKPNAESISSYFTKLNFIDKVEEKENYSKKKLINILEDIKISETDALNIISNVNPETLQSVDSIVAKNNEAVEEVPKTMITAIEKDPVESEEIEEIDLTSQEENILIPPTQFLDTTQNMEHPEDAAVKEDVPSSSKNKEGLTKKVSFDLSKSMEVDLHESIDSESIDNSAVSDDLTKIKDMMLQKHNLDSTPPFVYAKNTKLQVGTDDKIVTSKFFKNLDVINEGDEKTDEGAIKDNIADENNRELGREEENTVTNKPEQIDVSDDVSSPKRLKLMEMAQDKPVFGMLFDHGAQPIPIPDSLDLSVSTTGFEDADYPHCLDSSVLLSPNADLPLPMSDNNPEALSQGVPNFLPGFRKVGFSFFGNTPSSEPKPDSSAQNQEGSGFNFNFGGEEKKKRGGLFSMFQ